MSMAVTSKFKKIYEEEKKAKAARKAAKEPFSIRAGKFIKRWGLRLFYTVFFILFSYVFIMGITNLIPVTLGYIVGSMGYGLEDTAEIILAALTGLFFTAWIFAISFFVVRKVFAAYIKGMKKTLPEDAGERLDELTK